MTLPLSNVIKSPTQRSYRYLHSLKVWNKIWRHRIYIIHKCHIVLYEVGKNNRYGNIQVFYSISRSTCCKMFPPVYCLLKTWPRTVLWPLKWREREREVWHLIGQWLSWRPLIGGERSIEWPDIDIRPGQTEENDHDESLFVLPGPETINILDDTLPRQMCTLSLQQEG